MPNKDSHLRIVHENTAAINWVRQAQPPMPQWVVTIAFYKALHIIEAVFAADKKSPIRHADDHAQRNDVLRREPRYSHLWKHYRPLWNDSLIARYLQGNTGTDTYSGFADYMPLIEVEKKHLNHNLVQIVRTARTLIGDPTFLQDEYP
ncbi:MAG: hypothetical protein WCO86_20315 [Planctomycetota bacterium]